MYNNIAGRTTPPSAGATNEPYPILIIGIHTIYGNIIYSYIVFVYIRKANALHVKNAVHHNISMTTKRRAIHYCTFVFIYYTLRINRPCSPSVITYRLYQSPYYYYTHRALYMIYNM